MKKITTIVLLIFSTFYAYCAEEIEIVKGWNLLGAVEQIDEMATFDTKSVSSVWIYEAGNWSVYGPHGGVVSYPTMSRIERQKGYWLNAKEGATFEVLKKFTTYDERVVSVNLANSVRGFYLELTANISTGYDWSVAYYDGAVFAEPIIFTLQESDVVGSESTKRYLFKLLDGVSSTLSSIKLLYKRPWEESTEKELDIDIFIE